MPRLIRVETFQPKKIDSKTLLQENILKRVFLVSR